VHFGPGWQPFHVEFKGHIHCISRQIGDAICLHLVVSERSRFGNPANHPAQGRRI
jgi:hypothetical protein